MNEGALIGTKQADDAIATLKTLIDSGKYGGASNKGLAIAIGCLLNEKDAASNPTPTAPPQPAAPPPEKPPEEPKPTA